MTRSTLTVTTVGHKIGPRHGGVKIGPRHGGVKIGPRHGGV